jgi:hypothetical protein
MLRCAAVAASLSLAALAVAAPIPRDDVPDDAEPDTNSAPTASSAARLSFIEGNVRVTQDSQVIADPAVVNMPLFEGAEISTANDGRAEIQLEDGSIARLSPNSTIAISVLARQGTGTRTELVLRGGLAYFEIQPSNAEHSLRVNYGDAFFTATNFSVVRLIDDAPPAELAVFNGSVRLERTDALQLDVHSGETLTLDAADRSRYNLSSTIAGNSWDNWNTDRDQFLNAEAADKTAATGGLNDNSSDGMSDLDANGNWYNVPGQGYVWSPYDAQAEGDAWDPYGYGNWVSYPQYGYVWVSGYPWGYRPFQCGLWDYYEGFGWAWAPGHRCQPWWGGGGGWGYRIGNNPPPGYHHPHRPYPNPGPGKPRPRNGGPAPVTPRHLPGLPMIAVDRRENKTLGTSVPDHDSSTNGGTAIIAGQAIEPLPHLAPRQTYLHPGEGFVNRITPTPAPGQTGGTRSVYTPIAPVRPPVGTTIQPTPRPYTPNPYIPRYEPPRSYPPPAPRMSPPPPPRMSPPPPPRSAPPAAPHK